METERSLRRSSAGRPPPGDGAGNGAAGERSSRRLRRSSEGPEAAFTVERVVRFVLGALALAAVGWLLWYFASLVVYLVVGGLLAYLMRPVVFRIQSMGLGRLPAIVCAFVGVFGVVAFLVALLAPFAVQQVTELSQQVSVEAVSGTVRTLEGRLREALPFLEEGVLVEGLRGIADTLFRGERLQSTFNSALAIFTNLFYALLVIPFVTFFFLKDGLLLRRAALRWVPNRYFEVTLAILAKVETGLGRYLRALLVQCSAVAAVASVLLYVDGIDYALAVGIFAGLANSIPYFGPLMGFVAGSLVGIAQTGDFSLILPVLVAMALTQLCDNLVFQPFIFSKAAQAHPLVILFVVLIGAQLAGIVGMLLAIPTATVLRVVGREVLWSIRHYRILRT